MQIVTYTSIDYIRVLCKLAIQVYIKATEGSDLSNFCSRGHKLMVSVKRETVKGGSGAVPRVRSRHKAPDQGV